jgi:AraC family transcriptional regulator
MRLATYEDYCQSVASVVRFVHSNLDEELTISRLADVAFLSPNHFQRVFARIAGETTGQFVRRLRLERAAWQLQNSNRRILDIAFHAGFESQEAFARAFRVAFGSPATAFREAQWVSYQLLSPNRAHYEPNSEPEFRALHLRGTGTPFKVVDIKPMAVAYRLHEGAPHLIAKSLKLLALSLKPSGFDIWSKPMITFADNLRIGVDLTQIKSYVAVRVEDACDAVSSQLQLCGGRYLTSDYEGSGEGLGDFWFQVWAEALPASRMKIGNGPCFQIIRFSPGVHSGLCLNAKLYLPVVT